MLLHAVLMFMTLLMLLIFHYPRMPNHMCTESAAQAERVKKGTL